jgi:hypothetical protein
MQAVCVVEAVAMRLTFKSIWFTRLMFCTHENTFLFVVPIG